MARSTAAGVGDRVLQSVPHHLSDFQWEVVLGGLMGDGALSPTRSGHGARFRFCHGVKQADYADWKASLFANVAGPLVAGNGAVVCDVGRCRSSPSCARGVRRRQEGVQ